MFSSRQSYYETYRSPGPKLNILPKHQPTAYSPGTSESASCPNNPVPSTSTHYTHTQYPTNHTDSADSEPGATRTHRAARYGSYRQLNDRAGGDHDCDRWADWDSWREWVAWPDTARQSADRRAAGCWRSSQYRRPGAPRCPTGGENTLGVRLMSNWGSP